MLIPGKSCVKLEGSEAILQLVFEFGSSRVGPIAEAIRRVFGTSSYVAKCVPRGSDTNEPTNASLESLATQLETGEISSFTLHPEMGMIRYALVLTPSVDGPKRSFYLGTIEDTGKDYQSIWEVLLDTPGLTVACLGYDEGVELEDSHLTVETFPWSEWPLAIGALRDPSESESWTTREGPEMKWLTQVP